MIRSAPNGDFFVAESYAGRIKVFRGITARGGPEYISVFATGLRRLFGIAFYPPGEHKQWLYVANTDSVVRFPYQNGDLTTHAPAITVIDKLPAGAGHWTRDIAFSLDGTRMFVSVGSRSNVGDPRLFPIEDHRANILDYTVDGSSSS